MAYEGHIAGVGDAAPGQRLKNIAIRAMQRRSARELSARRAEVVAAVREVAELEFVNGGGTGSIAATAAEPAVTEIAAGSGFYAPVLFDHYSSFELLPAAGFALAVDRKPSPRIATALGGGYIASGPAGQPTAFPSPTSRAACASTRSRPRARSRRRCSARPPRACGSATASTSATPRPASCASASTPCT